MPEAQRIDITTISHIKYYDIYFDGEHIGYILKDSDSVSVHLDKNKISSVVVK